MGRKGRRQGVASCEIWRVGKEGGWNLSKVRGTCSGSSVTKRRK